MVIEADKERQDERKSFNTDIRNRFTECSKVGLD